MRLRSFLKPKESPSAEQPPPVARFGRRRAPPARLPQDRVDLIAIWASDRHPVEPFEVLEVRTRDLPERPAVVAPEVQDTARWVARWLAGGAHVVRRAHRLVVATADRRAAARPVARDGLGLRRTGLRPARGRGRRSGGGMGSIRRRGGTPGGRAAPPALLRDTAAWRARCRSWAARRPGSPSTSHAALIASIRPLDSAPVAVSGWYLRARRRYAAAITSSSASGSTWRTLYGSDPLTPARSQFALSATVGTPGCVSSPRVAIESARAVESPGLARRNR